MAQSLFPNQPALPAHIERVFLPLCEALAADKVDQLRIQVQRYFADTTHALDRNEFTDVALAEEIVDVLRLLFATYDEASSPRQAWIVGAARYFVLHQDAEPDGSLLGFEDDVLVLNYVLDQLGHPELKIEL